MIKAVFLDVDGTLLDFDGYVKQSMKDGFEKFGIGEYEEGMFAVFTRENNKLWQALERGELTFDELRACRWNVIFKALGLEGDGVAFEEYFRRQLFTSAIPIDGSEELLEYLREKYLLCVSSNGPYRQQINRLSLGGMLDSFDYLFISEDMGIAKPDKLFFDRALERMSAKGVNLTPDEIMVIGDSLTSDIALGKNAGAHTCLYDRRGKYPAGSAEYTVSTLEEIKNIL